MDISHLQQAIRDEGLDGWLFFDHHHRDPLAYRVLGLAQDTQVTRRWYYFIPAKGDPRKLIHRIEPHVLDGLPGSELHYSRWDEQIKSLESLLKGARRIAMQYSANCAVPYVSMVDAGTLELVRSCGLEPVSSADLIQLFEARWSQQQLESHVEAGRRMDRLRHQAFEFMATSLRTGATVDEWLVRKFLLDGFAAAGLVTDHGPIVAVNQNASDPHYEPTAEKTRPIGRGDLVLIDMWAKLDSAESVFYDITWTGFCGPTPPAQQQRVFEIVRDARDAAIHRVSRAVSSHQKLQGFEVDDAARAVIVQSGFGDYFIHRTGHSIGVNIHGAGANMDNFETHDERAVIPWTAFSVEPGIYLPEFGIRSEVNVFIGENEARVTGEIQRELVLIQ